MLRKVFVNNQDLSVYSEYWSKRIDEKLELDSIVDSIIGDIRKRGDKALLDITERIDGIKLESVKVSDEEIENAFTLANEDFINILQEAKENIKLFHEKQLQKSWIDCGKNNVILGQLVTPIERVGIYVPGGKAAYPSSVLMNSIPAKIAGVSTIAMATPPGRDGRVNPHILVAAKIAGVDEIYKVGGAQAVAALAYGTDTIKPVHKIVGPGNAYVARAKQKVYGQVGIDMVAGPSEICIVADESANPIYIAADILSQAEHDELASTILITTSEKIAEEVFKELSKQSAILNRREIIQKSLESHGIAFIVDGITTGLNLANELAPEHLELLVDEPFHWLSNIKNAGAVFIGGYSPEPLGDYFAGPNHTLPTNGTAKFSSALGVEDFQKKSSIIYYDKNNLNSVKDKIITFAETEGLQAHANSIRVRFS